MVRKPMAKAVEGVMEWLWWQWQEVKCGGGWVRPGTLGPHSYPIYISSHGALRIRLEDLVASPEFRRQLAAVGQLRMAAENPFFMSPYPSSTIADQIREKYRGHPYVSDLP